ncbi:MOSC domain-containing protein YiiM [Ammoniphilus resinae]|uniref:MOSC domain-containing protein YiiM n=1 Tax=Ammoniphilus resinae TaxID=861532 RepID=A0ABS4GIU6_9BACL|nr:MOSC domain-containing protein YiiM [Ammoniphilus resinae]
MTNPIVLSIQVGKPKSLGTSDEATSPMDRMWTSAIIKEKVEGPIWLGETNLEGDEQADLEHHGGPEKAVLAYASAHYPFWQGQLGLPDIPFGGFGENLTVAGLTEADVCIGDTYEMGEVIVQVSQPRRPCWKLARRWKIKDLTLRVQNTGCTGWYLRVLKTGYIKDGDTLKLIERPYPEWTVERCNQLIHGNHKTKLEEVKELANCTLLSQSWRDTLFEIIAKGEKPDTQNRVIGPNE